MKKEDQAADTLFEGWEDASDVDYLNEDDTDVEPVDVDEAVEDDDIDEEDDDVTDVDDDGADDTPKAKSKKKKEEEVDDDFLNFNDDGEEEEEDEEEDEPSPKDKKKKEPSSKMSSSALLQSLKERGLADYELEEGQELNDELADELLEDAYENGVESKVEELIKGLPPVTRDLMKFAINGGSESEFLSKLTTSKAGKITEDMDLESEASQILVMETNLKEEGYDDDYIRANLEFLKDNGKLASVSKTVHKKLVDKQKREREAEVNRVASQKAAQKERLREMRKDISQMIAETEDLGGFTVSKQDKEEMPDYMTNQSIKNGDSTITPFQRDMFSALQDRKKAMILAKIFRNDFDFSDIANATKTKQAKDIKSNVRRTKKSADTGSSQKKTRQRKSLADML